jgi:NADH:ubiquinone oxidoreductase subunit 4 (subunit M)
MLSRILRTLLGIVLVVGAGIGLLLGGYGLSWLLIPNWPQDYHATAAIALMSLGLIGYAGWVAMREPPKKKRSGYTTSSPKHSGRSSEATQSE